MHFSSSPCALYSHTTQSAWFNLSHSLHGTESFLRNQMRAQKAKEISAFHGIWRFITMFTRAHHWTLTWASWTQYSYLVFYDSFYIILISSLPHLQPLFCKHFSLSHACYMPSVSHKPRFYQPNNWSLQGPTFVRTGSGTPEVSQLPRACGYNWATQLQGYINSEDWTSRLEVGRKASDLTLENVYCYEISNKNSRTRLSKTTFTNSKNETWSQYSNLECTIYALNRQLQGYINSGNWTSR
jgi:hypothetical protein